MKCLAGFFAMLGLIGFSLTPQVVRDGVAQPPIADDDSSKTEYYDDRLANEIFGDVDVLTSPRLLKTSLISLIANPSDYHGKIVRVTGYFVYEEEMSFMFLCKEHADYSVFKNAITINIPLQAQKTLDPKLLTESYIIVEGEFKNSNGMTSGIIEKPYRITILKRP